MSRSVELSDEDYARLERAAEVERITPAEWIARRIPMWAGSEPLTCPDGTPARTMADVLAGRIGLFSSGNGLPSSDNVSESFAEYLEQKQREGRL
jgi:hypothetical protein